MKKIDYQNVKGTLDYLPEEESVRRDIRRTLEDVFIRYGCQPLETPILNYTKLLASKYGGGKEILEEMYTLTDRGERDLALRYDLTIPFAKVVAMNPSIRIPFKRYEIGKVFRDGPVKLGRYREFTQCDVDIVGVESQIAEAELMLMALDAFRELGLNVTIQYNNRKVLTGMLEIFNVGDEKVDAAILILDKLEKNGLESVLNELEEIGLSMSTINLLNQFLIDENNSNLNYFESYATQNIQVEQGLRELKELESYLEIFDTREQCVFNPVLARGLEIYTGTVYEVFLSDGFIQSSIGSGGRYDNAIGGLIGTDEILATAGISFGLDVIYAAMSESTSEEKENKMVDYYIIPIGTRKESLMIANKLRSNGFKVELEMRIKKVRKALERANKEKYRKVILVGENEIANNQYRIKDMFSGEEVVKSFQFNMP